MAIRVPVAITITVIVIVMLIVNPSYGRYYVFNYMLFTWSFLILLSLDTKLIYLGNRR